MQIVLSVLAVLILVTTSLQPSQLVTNPAKLKANSLVLSSSQPPYYPYVQSPATFPRPDNITSPYGPAYFPELATSEIANVTLYDMVYSVNVTGVGSALELSQGSYNASMAQMILNTSSCSTSPCVDHVPISWSPPVPIAVFGDTMIQADAIATWSDCVAVAATVSGQTSLFLAENFGTSNWSLVTGVKPVAGGSPKLLLQNGSIVLTTLAPSLHVAEFNNLCPAELPAWNTAGHFHSLVDSGPPVVSAVVPYQSPLGNWVMINGTNLAAATQVFFGSASAAAFNYTGSQLWAEVPGGSGTQSVEVVTGYGESQATCASQFQFGGALTYGTPQVESVSPTGGRSGTAVTIDGVYFTHSSKVFFGSTLASSSYVGSGIMDATSPSGISGTVNITVENSVGYSATTCADHYDYQPVVTGLLAAGGSSGNAVAIYGSFFTSSSTVRFGSTSSSSVHYISSTELEAKAPTGAGTVDVTVRQGNATSATTCSDRFTYTSMSISGAPQILAITPSVAVSGGTVTLSGVNFTTSMLVNFGVETGYISSLNSTSAKVVVPLGNGSVPVEVADSSGASFSVCQDHVDIESPAAPAYLQERSTVLGGAISDSPVWNITGQLEILADNSTNNNLIVYRQALTGLSFESSEILAVNTSSGSSIFNRLGDTETTVPDSSPGEVALASSGNNLFALYTTNANGVTVVRAVVSGSSGQTWTGPYELSTQVGSAVDPQVAFGESGYVYGAWVNGEGQSWSVNQATFSPAGRVISNENGNIVTIAKPNADSLPGSGESSGLANASLSLSVDPLQRPILAWSGQGILGPNLEYTGGFVSPSTELSIIEAGFHDTHYPADYMNIAWNSSRPPYAGVSPFMGAVNRTFNNLSLALTPLTTCRAFQVAAGQIYPNVTHLDYSAIISGPSLPSCSVSIGARGNSRISGAEVGPLTANVYLGVESEVLLESLGYGTMPNPSWAWQPGNSGYGVYNASGNSSVVTTWGEVFSVQPVTINPNTVWLHVTDSIPRTASGDTLLINASAGGLESGFRVAQLVPDNYTASVYVPATSSSYETFTDGNDALPSVYLEDLNPQANGTYALQISIKFAVYWQEGTGGDEHALTGPWNRSDLGTTYWTNITIDGTFTTGLSFSNPGGMVMNVPVSPSPNAYDDWAMWNNTMDARAAAWINNTHAEPPTANWTDSSLQLGEYAHAGYRNDWDGITPNDEPYTATFVIQSTRGVANTSWLPSYDTGESTEVYPNLTASWSCSFIVNTTAIEANWSATNNLTITSPTSATIIWYTNSPGVGWVTATESPQDVSVMTSASRTSVEGGGYQFEAQLHGLDAWGFYHVDIHELVQYGCARYLYSFSASEEWDLQLPATFPVQEQDLPYDSITKEGGGADITWEVPDNFTEVATYRSGALLYFPEGVPSNVTNIPISTPSSAVIQNRSWSGGGQATTYQLNLSVGLTPNTTYVVELFLNYSEPSIFGGGNVTVPATSEPFSFIYLRDTSGDGLSVDVKAAIIYAPPLGGA